MTNQKRKTKIRKVEVTNIFERNINSKKQIILNEGGARSSKSYSICQLLIYRFINRNNYSLLITRKTLPSLRLTAYKLFVDLLSDYRYYHLCVHNKSERLIKYKKNFVVFTSIDDPEKIKSTEFNDAWLEEANEFTYQDYITIKTRLSAKKEPDNVNQMFLSYNPTDEFGYCNSKLKFNKDVEVFYSTYKDNPFLDDEYINLLESLKEQDINYYKIYALGEYAQIEGIIYKPYTIKEEYPDTFDEIIYGLDFGFNNPTALIKIGIKDKAYYLTEVIYQSKLTNQDVIKLLGENNVSKKDYIYCDSAEPNRIEEIHKAGYIAKPANKSVKDGIDFCKRQTFYTTADNVNLNNERKSYCYKKDKYGIAIDEPIKFNDHLMDAKRYAVYTHNKKTEIHIW